MEVGRLLILTINTGSSTIKYSLFREDKELLAKTIETARDHEAVMQEIAGSLEEKPDGIGHRFVHGGREFFRPTRVTKKVIEKLEKETFLAPLHLPQELSGLRAMLKALPEIPQVLCFDTAFHQTLPEVAKRYPLADTFWNEGVRRYGFHGLSYESIVERIDAKKKTIIAHLGSGCSLAAVKEGKSIETTMGFSPTGGVMMGTRSGDLDPGLFFYLLDHGYTKEKIEHLLNHEAGLFGMAGDADVRNIEEGSLALTLFCYQVKKAIGSLAAVLGSLEQLVFTGGIGENSAFIRKEICKGLDFLGNFSVEAMPAEENRMIAKHVREVLSDAHH